MADKELRQRVELGILAHAEEGLEDFNRLRGLLKLNGGDSGDVESGEVEAGVFGFHAGYGQEPFHVPVGLLGFLVLKGLEILGRLGVHGIGVNVRAGG